MLLSMMARLVGRRSPIRNEQEFSALLERQSAYIAQRCTLEYCRLRTGFDWDKLMQEDGFADSVDVCRWEAYAAVAGDLTIMFEGMLRPHWTAQLPDLGDALLECFSGALHLYDPPAHLPDGWAPEVEAFRTRIGLAQTAAPQRPYLIGRVGGERIFHVLPIHRNLREHHLQLIQNNVRINMCRLHEDLRGIFDAPAIAEDIRRSRRLLEAKA